MYMYTNRQHSWQMHPDKSSASNHFLQSCTGDVAFHKYYTIRILHFTDKTPINHTGCNQRMHDGKARATSM